MSDEWTTAGLGRDVERLYADLREIRRDYVTEKLHLELAARVGRLEAGNTAETSGNRTWLLGLVQTAFGVLLAVLGAYLMAKGGR